MVNKTNEITNNLKDMKKKVLSTVKILLASALLCSCASTPSYYSMSGTMAGASIGSQLGEAIGWISGGNNRYGSSLVGRVIGTAAGAGIGYTITQKQIDNANRQYDNDNRQYDNGTYRTEEPVRNQSNNHNYRPTTNTPKRNFRIGNAHPTRNNSLQISNISYQDENGDGNISKGETCTISYEVTNNTHWLISDLVVEISEESFTKRYAFSPSTPNVSISPEGTIRYKANVYCKKKPNQPSVAIKLSAYSNEKSLEVSETLTIPTAY